MSENKLEVDGQFLNENDYFYVIEDSKLNIFRADKDNNELLAHALFSLCFDSKGDFKEIFTHYVIYYSSEKFYDAFDYYKTHKLDKPITTNLECQKWWHENSARILSKNIGER